MAKIKKPTKHQKDYEPEVVRLTALWQRALADYQNLEKRTNNERQQFIKLANDMQLNPQGNRANAY